LPIPSPSWSPDWPHAPAVAREGRLGHDHEAGLRERMLLERGYGERFGFSDEQLVEQVGGGVVSNDVFLAGYGAAQAVPGPLFTFAAYLGALSRTAATGWAGATIALVGVFLPGYLLVIGLLPLWERARRHAAAARALQGINAAVVGLLLAALYTPVGTSAIGAPADLALALVAFLFLTVGKLAPWLVVVGGAALATLIDR